MAYLNFFKLSELDKIARFLTYGTHIEGWVRACV